MVDPANDVFGRERRAIRIEKILSSLLGDGGLPVATQIRGSSPMPVRYEEHGRVLEAVYESGAEGFSKGMIRWIEALGEIRRADFHALPNEVVRFEIASETPAGLE